MIILRLLLNSLGEVLNFIWNKAKCSVSCLRQTLTLAWDRMAWAWASWAETTGPLCASPPARNCQPRKQKGNTIKKPNSLVSFYTATPPCECVQTFVVSTHHTQTHTGWHLRGKWCVTQRKSLWPLMMQWGRHPKWGEWTYYSLSWRVDSRWCK